MKEHNKKKIFIFITLILFLIFSIIFLDYIRIYSLSELGYSTRSSYLILRNKNYYYIKENDYNELIDKFIENDGFDDNYIKEYNNLNYVNKTGYLSIINKLINKGYLTIDINNIVKKYDKNLIEYLINNKVNDISNYLEYDYFKTDNIDRYIKYFNGNYKDTIIKVNINMDKVNNVNNYSITMLVNKNNKLNSKFIPKNLEKVNNCTYNDYYLTKEAKEAFEKMCNDSIKNNLSMYIVSAYRSYNDQKNMFNYYLNEFGQEYVDNYVANAGYSEHQTGLAVDIASIYMDDFKKSNEYKWLLNNSYKYGFILRYTKDNQNITLYNSEPWHYRYVGIDIANYIYNNNISFEEYYAMKL